MTQQTPVADVTAALLIIGNEILSGRTKDANLPFLAEKLNGIGVRLREARVVPDIEAEIIEAAHSFAREIPEVQFLSVGQSPPSTSSSTTRAPSTRSPTPRWTRPRSRTPTTSCAGHRRR